MALHTSTGTTAPTTTPNHEGAHFTDTVADEAYLATGVASSSDWKKVATSGASLSTLKFDYILLKIRGASNYVRIEAVNDGGVYVLEVSQTPES